jgi:hypothetical protein
MFLSTSLTYKTEGSAAVTKELRAGCDFSLMNPGHISELYFSYKRCITILLKGLRVGLSCGRFPWGFPPVLTPIQDAH